MAAAVSVRFLRRGSVSIRHRGEKEAWVSEEASDEGLVVACRRLQTQTQAAAGAPNRSSGCKAGIRVACRVVPACSKQRVQQMRKNFAFGVCSRCCCCVAASEPGPSRFCGLFQHHAKPDSSRPLRALALPAAYVSPKRGQLDRCGEVCTIAWLGLDAHLNSNRSIHTPRDRQRRPARRSRRFKFTTPNFGLVYITSTPPNIKSLGSAAAAASTS